MIAAMVGAILVIVLALIAVWLISPAFRTWSEQPKYRMLQRNALFERTGIGADSKHRTAGWVKRNEK